MKKILLLIVSVSLGVASVCAVQAATTQKTDNEDTANDVEYEDPWPEWEPKENK